MSLNEVDMFKFSLIVIQGPKRQDIFTRKRRLGAELIKEGGDKNRQKLCLRKDTMTILKKTSLNDNDLTYNINKYDITYNGMYL